MNRRMNFMGFMALFFVSFAITSHAQYDVREISLKKGEVLDILLLTQKADKNEVLQKYFKDAVSVAMKSNYTPLPGYRIGQMTKGNIEPENLVFGKWGSVEERKGFGKDILLTVPDFHERRRDIWSYFGLTYYEMNQDISFKIDRNKPSLCTALWFEDGVNAQKQSQLWIEKAINAGASILIQLQDGSSPFGYNYNPDLLVITTWKNDKQMQKFASDYSSISKKNVLHINEYLLN